MLSIPSLAPNKKIFLFDPSLGIVKKYVRTQKEKITQKIEIAIFRRRAESKKSNLTINPCWIFGVDDVWGDFLFGRS